MILLTAVLAGSMTGWGYARWKGRAWHPPIFRAIWLVFLGFIPQWIAFYLPTTRQLLTDEIASGCLILSQIILMAFALLNLRVPGMVFLALGLGCNLIVIVANGGFMPLPFETAAGFVERSHLESLTLGERISSASKDILLKESEIYLPWFADRFVPPSFVPYRFAFSMGDVGIAIGAFWMLVQPPSLQANVIGDS